ncbi:ORF6N domain-containing protein [Candidatus Saccharibacteria bacterium]|nr:ORF6N domain-containing protein [Candidatus Saccharibacteria bacterium]
MENSSILRLQDTSENNSLRSRTLILDAKSLIYEIRGRQVMLDADVAKLYQVETKRVNEVIKRNIKRFPELFCFKLTEDEFDVIRLRSQFATLDVSGGRGRYSKYLPYALTEQGIMMLSGLLKSDIAVRVNIRIINAFVEMRRYFANTVENNEILINHENRLLKIEAALDSFSEKPVDKIFFAGELYDSHSLLLDIFSSAKQEIIIIDNYIGKELLDILKDISQKIIIVSKNINSTLKKKYESQYRNIEFIHNNSFHDRFIIIDQKTLYHSGASFKDLGKKCFAIHEINDKNYLNQMLKTVTTP